jgi:hypothetical protein
MCMLFLIALALNVDGVMICRFKSGAGLWDSFFTAKTKLTIFVKFCCCFIAPITSEHVNSYLSAVVIDSLPMKHERDPCTSQYHLRGHLLQPR